MRNEMREIGNTPADKTIVVLFKKLDEMRLLGLDKIKNGEYDLTLKKIQVLTSNRLNQEAI